MDDIPSETRKTEYRRLVADHSALERQHDQLKVAVAKLLSLPSIGFHLGPSILIILKRSELDALDEVYRKACGYD